MLQEGRRSWGTWRWLWVILPGVLLFSGVSDLDAKRIKIRKDALVDPADSLTYQLEPYPYRIAPGDHLFVDYGLILDGKQITADGIVRPDGAISLPRVGDVVVAGLSTVEVDSVLTELYADVYVAPDITVAVREVAGNVVHVLGQVGRPGSYPMMPNLTALQAVSLAGGFQKDASKGAVVVLRRTGPNQMVARQIDLDAAMDQGRASQDLFLRRYDIVVVNRNTIGNISLFVDRFLGSLLTASNLYIRGWEVFHLDRVFPVREQSALRPE